MLQSEARVATPNGRKYLNQLCKHWAHKLPVVQTDASGRVEFPWGVGEFEVEDDALIMRVASEEPELLEKLEAGVGDHLARFAFREKLEIAWRRLDA